MKDVLDSERRRRKLHHGQRSVLASLTDHWEGLTVFRDSPQIPMDSNGNERVLKTPAVARKNHFGSATDWSARFTAMLFIIFETLALWQINELEWWNSPESPGRRQTPCGSGGDTRRADARRV
jgi:hypothetical protein